MSLLDGMLGCWSPSVTGSGYLLPDLSGRNNHGTLENMDAADWLGASIRGRSSKVLSYNNASVEKKVTIGASLPNLAGSPELTFTMWARRRAANAIANIGQVNSSRSVYLNIVAWSTGVIYFQAYPSYVVFADNETGWKFWAMTLKGSVLRGYRDGGLVTSGAGPAAVPSVVGDFVIGPYPPISQKANSDIGEVAVWQKALSPAEISELNQQGNGAIGRRLTGRTRRVYSIPSGVIVYGQRIPRHRTILGGGLR